MNLKRLTNNKIILPVIISIFLVLLNVALIYPLFRGEYTQYMGSIEPVFIADAKYIVENFSHQAWQPFWYAGFSFHNVYTPIVPYLLAFLNTVLSFFSIAHWYRILLALAYVITPVSLFFLARYLLKRNLDAFIVSFSFSLISFPAFFFSEVDGMSRIFGRAPWSLFTALIFGEGPHIMTLAILPLAALLFLKALRKATFKNVILAAVFVALTALTNWISLVGIAVIFIIILFSEMVYDKGWQKFKTAMLIALIAYGLSAFWLNLSFIKASLSISTGGAAGSLYSNYTSFLPLLLIIFPVVIFLIANFLKKKRHLQPLFIALAWLVAFYLAAFFWYKYEKMILPQPNRYLPEMGMAASIILAIVFGYIFNLIKFKKNKLAIAVKTFFTLAVIGIVIFGARGYFQVARSMTSPHQDIESTTEYKMAKWLEKNVPDNERVYLTGSHAFWLNTFVDVLQLRGGNEGVANPWTQHATYQIYHEPDADISIFWAKAFNMGYILVNYPNSDNAFHDYISPDKFVGELPEVYNQGGDAIYQVSLQYPSLAQVVDAKRIDSLVTPAKGDDRKNIKAYALWVDDEAKRNAEVSWINRSEFVVKADVQNDEALQLQMTYDKGWKAKVDGKSLKIRQDVIGNMYLKSSQTGQLEIRFKYGKTWDVWFGYLITFITFIWIIYNFYILRKPAAKNNK